LNRSLEEEHDTLFKLKVKDYITIKLMVLLKVFIRGSYYEPPTPKIGKEVKTIRMVAFFCYTVSILLSSK